jgi:hypothetical protein
VVAEAPFLLKQLVFAGFEMDSILLRDLQYLCEKAFVGSHFMQNALKLGKREEKTATTTKIVSEIFGRCLASAALYEEAVAGHQLQLQGRLKKGTTKKKDHGRKTGGGDTQDATAGERKRKQEKGRKGLLVWEGERIRYRFDGVFYPGVVTKSKGNSSWPIVDFGGGWVRCVRLTQENKGECWHPEGEGGGGGRGGDEGSGGEDSPDVERGKVEAGQVEASKRATKKSGVGLVKGLRNGQRVQSLEGAKTVEVRKGGARRRGAKHVNRGGKKQAKPQDHSGWGDDEQMKRAVAASMVAYHQQQGGHGQHQHHHHQQGQGVEGGHSAAAWEEGAKVETYGGGASGIGGAKWYAGVVAKVHTDDARGCTFDIEYEDGDREERVRMHMVRSRVDPMTKGGVAAKGTVSRL